MNSNTINKSGVNNKAADFILSFGQRATPYFISSSSNGTVYLYDHRALIAADDYYYSKIIGANNNTTPENNQSYYELFPFEIVLYSVLYCLTIITAVVGNVLVIWVVMRTRHVRQSNTNYFIINLALVDLFIMIFNLPWTFIYTVNGNVWPWGTIWCKLVWSIGTVALSANAFTFSAIMLDRYNAIVNPLHKYVERRRRVILALVVIWLLSFLTGLPTLLGYEAEYITQEQVPRTVCKNNWSGETEFIHVVVLVIVQYAVPLVLTLIAYRFIRLKLFYSKAIGESSAAEANAIKMKRKVVSMMMVIVATFSICVFPNNIFVLVLNSPQEEIQTKLIRPLEHGRAVIRTFLTVYWLAMSNSMWNPFIYAYWNSTFRLGFKYAFRWLPSIHWDPDVDAKKFFDHRRTLSTVTYRGTSYLRSGANIGETNGDSAMAMSVIRKTSSQQQPLIANNSNNFIDATNNGHLTGDAGMPDQMKAMLMLTDSSHFQSSLSHRHIILDSTSINSC